MATNTVTRDTSRLPGPTPGRNPAGGYKVPTPGAGYQHKAAQPPVLVRGKAVHKRMMQVTRGFEGATPIPRSTLVPTDNTAVKKCAVCGVTTTLLRQAVTGTPVCEGCRGRAKS